MWEAKPCRLWLKATMMLQRLSRYQRHQRLPLTPKPLGVDGGSELTSKHPRSSSSTASVSAIMGAVRRTAVCALPVPRAALGLGAISATRLRALSPTRGAVPTRAVHVTAPAAAHAMRPCSCTCSLDWPRRAQPGAHACDWAPHYSAPPTWTCCGGGERVGEMEVPKLNLGGLLHPEPHRWVQPAGSTFPTTPRTPGGRYDSSAATTARDAVLSPELDTAIRRAVREELAPLLDAMQSNLLTQLRQVLTPFTVTHSQGLAIQGERYDGPGSNSSLM